MSQDFSQYTSCSLWCYIGSILLLPYVQLILSYCHCHYCLFLILIVVVLIVSIVIALSPVYGRD